MNLLFVLIVVLTFENLPRALKTMSKKSLEHHIHAESALSKADEGMNFTPAPLTVIDLNSIEIWLFYSGFVSVWTNPRQVK